MFFFATAALTRGKGGRGTAATERQEVCVLSLATMGREHLRQRTLLWSAQNCLHTFKVC